MLWHPQRCEKFKKKKKKKEGKNTRPTATEFNGFGLRGASIHSRTEGTTFVVVDVKGSKIWDGSTTFIAGGLRIFRCLFLMFLVGVSMSKMLVGFGSY